MATGNVQQISVKFGHVVREICEQTDRHADHNTLLPCGSKVKISPLNG